MASKYNNKKNILIISMTPKEACSLGRGITLDGKLALLDDISNRNIINDEAVYYICGNDSLVCKATLNNYLRVTTPTKDDYALSVNTFKNILKTLSKNESGQNN